MPETFPGVKFDSHGVCNHCRRRRKIAEEGGGKRDHYIEKFENIIKKSRGNAPDYDVIMAFSGGKDSSYTAKLLKEVYGLRILALTFDNHFISPVAMENIQTVTDNLGIDHLMVRLPWRNARSLFNLASENDIFSKPTLLRASTICTACIGLVKSIVLKTALEKRIPLVAFGWSPGQAPVQSATLKNNPAMVESSQRSFMNALPEKMRKEFAPFFIDNSLLRLNPEIYPYNIHPLAFCHYDESEIKDALTRIGWVKPSDTDSNSTNCLLNAFANQCHIERHGYHPYVWEIANMVRQGIMSRQEGIDKIYVQQNPVLVDYAKSKLMD